MKLQKTLRIELLDGENNITSISISNPKEEISSQDIDPLVNHITLNNIMNGKVGYVVGHGRSVLIERKETEI